MPTRGGGRGGAPRWPWRPWQSCVATPAGVSCVATAAGALGPIECYLLARLAEEALRAVVHDVGQSCTRDGVVGVLEAACLE